MARVKPGGWALNEKLTSAQSTQMDINIDEIADLTQILGVKKLRTYADRDAMTAETSYEDGDIVYVVGDGAFPLGGLYRFDETSTLNGTGYDRPDDILLAAPGRWVSAMATWVGRPFGAAQLDDFGRLPAATVKNGLVDQDYVRVGGAYLVTEASATVTGSSMTTSIPLLPGDRVDVEYTFQQIDKADWYAAILAVDGAAAETGVGYQAEWKSVQDSKLSISGQFQNSATGAATFRLVALREPGPTPELLLGYLTKSYKVWRP